MMYRWRNLRFDAPDGRDDTSIVLIDPAESPAWNVSVRLDDLPGGATAFAAYFDGLKPPDGVKVQSRTPTTIGGRSGGLVEQHLKAERGETLRQHQAFVVDGNGVIIVTMTSRGAAHAVAKAAFDRMVSSMIWEAM